MKTIKVDEDGDFVLYKEVYPRKSYGATHGYWRNTITGENCGKTVEVYDGDDDCYELITNESEGVSNER